MAASVALSEDQDAAPDDDGDEALLKKLKRWEREARQHWSEWRQEAKLSYDFVAGHQWSADDKADLLEQLRQPVTINRVAPMVDAVTGAEILNRQEVRYSPREQGDVQVNELITAADEWARELADTEDEESDAFSDVVICGLGWSETRMDYSEDPEGRIVDDRIDPFEMWVDSQSRKRCFADARYVLRARWRNKDDLPTAWLKRLPDDANAPGATDELMTGETGPRDDYERDDEPPFKDRGEGDSKRVWIRHFQWWELVPAYRVADPLQGKLTTLNRKQLRAMGEMYLQRGMRPPKAVKIEVKEYHEAFVAGNVILEQREIESKTFTFKAITGKRDRNAGTFYGIVRAMIDPQMWGNKFFVQIMHILNTSAKGGLLYETGALINPQKALEDWAKPDAAIEVKGGALAAGKIQEREAKNYPQGLDRMMEFALNALPQTSGISMEMLGLVERDQPGVLEAQRKKAGYAILAVFFDSLRRYRKMKGRLRLYFIQNYISDGRLIRIKGQDSTQRYVPLVRQKDTATYDVIVDDAPMSPNQKEAVWQMLMGMMPMLTRLEVPPQVWQVMLEYSPLPSSVSAKINQILTQQAQQPPPPDPKMIEGQQKMQIAGQKAQLDAAGEQQRLQSEAAMNQMDQQARAAQLQATLVESDLKVRTAREMANIQIETARARAVQAARPNPDRKAA